MLESRSMAIDYLYHATRKSSLASILENGLCSSYYGQIHGSMAYTPPEKAVYLSTYTTSNNLHSNLFDGDDDQVIVLKIDIKDLDTKLFYPDDAFFYMLDAEYCADADDMDIDDINAFVLENYEDFMDDFGFTDVKKAKQILKSFLKSDGSAEEYANIAKDIGVEYLIGQGEIAYLGDVPSSAIVSWEIHPNSPNKELCLSI